MRVVELLVWRDNTHFEVRYGEPHQRPCVLCGNPTPMRSHRGEPAHKVCAESWNAANHDQLKVRFVSDANHQSRRKRRDDHA